MFVIATETLIGDILLSYANSISIKSAWNMLTDTCTIRIPRNIKTSKGLSIQEELKYGSKVSVMLGYTQYGITQRFTGYVAQVSADTPVIEVYCEDEMWALKQVSFSGSWKNADLNDVLNALKTKANAKWEFETIGDTVSLGAVRFENLSIAKCLQKLKDEYGMVCFFRQGKLIVGKPYDTNPGNRRTVELAYGSNVISWKSLKFKRKEECKVKVRVVNHKANGNKEEITVGDADGDERTLDFYNRNTSDLKAEAETYLDKLKYDGYRGTLLLFAEPEVSHGDVVSITDARYAERDGSYFIDEVTTEVRVSSIRQTITLGPKL
jgi:hypothetical protein